MISISKSQRLLGSIGKREIQADSCLHLAHQRAKPQNDLQSKELNPQPRLHPAVTSEKSLYPPPPSVDRGASFWTLRFVIHKSGSFKVKQVETPLKNNFEHPKRISAEHQETSKRNFHRLKCSVATILKFWRIFNKGPIFSFFPGFHKFCSPSWQSLPILTTHLNNQRKCFGKRCRKRTEISKNPPGEIYYLSCLQNLSFRLSEFFHFILSNSLKCFSIGEKKKVKKGEKERRKILFSKNQHYKHTTISVIQTTVWINLIYPLLFFLLAEISRDIATGWGGGGRTGGLEEGLPVTEMPQWHPGYQLGHWCWRKDRAPEGRWRVQRSQNLLKTHLACSIPDICLGQVSAKDKSRSLSFSACRESYSIMNCRIN